MDWRARWLQFRQKVDARGRGERALVAALLLLVAGWFYLANLHDPLIMRLDQSQRQLSTLESRIAAVQARIAAAQMARDHDPAAPLRQRLERVRTEQNQIDAEIVALTGSLVSPEAMTDLLTAVLAQQPGLQLRRLENRPPEALRSGSELAQVYRHGLLIEFEGDFLNALRYLLLLENLPQRFFWDSLQLRQLQWPRATITLELHTLSAQEGFIGA